SSPSLAASQRVPPFVVLNTPSSRSPAYTVLGWWGSITNAARELPETKTEEFGNPLDVSLQLVPPLVVLKIAPDDAAYTMLGWAGPIAKSRTRAPGSPAEPWPQLIPPFVVLKTSPPNVPAYTVLGVRGSIARVLTKLSLEPGRPEDASFQLVPPSVVLNT